MFIRTTKIKNDEIVYLVEGYRDHDGKSKHRIIEKYGLLSELKKQDPNILEKLKYQAALCSLIVVVQIPVVIVLSVNQLSFSP